MLYIVIKQTREGQVTSEVFNVDGTGQLDSSRQVRDRSGVLLWVLAITSVPFFPPLGLVSVYFMITARKQYKDGNTIGAKARSQLSQIFAAVAMVMGAVWIGLVIGLAI